MIRYKMDTKSNQTHINSAAWAARDALTEISKEENEIDVMALQSEIEFLQAELVHIRSKLTSMLKEIDS